MNDAPCAAEEHPHTRAPKRPRTGRTYTKSDAERVWRLVTHGGRECISGDNEASVRQAVLALCDSVQLERDGQRQALEAKSDAARLIRALLEEEVHVASLVRASAERGDAW